MKHGWEKIPNWECLFVHREKGLLLSVYVDDIKLAVKKQNLDPMWTLPNKEVDLGEPTSFLDHVYLGCTQRHCEISKDIVDNYRTMCESRISAGEYPGKNGEYSEITENFEKSECPDIWIRLPRHKWPKSWSSVEDPVVPLERNLYGHPLAGLLWERQFEKILLKYSWEKVSNLGMFIRTP